VLWQTLLFTILSDLEDKPLIADDRPEVVELVKVTLEGGECSLRTGLPGESINGRCPYWIGKSSPHQL